MPQEPSLEKHKPTRNPFSSFAWFPPKVNFATQEKKEKIVLLLRRHWVSNMGWILMCVFFILLPYIFSFLDGLAFTDSLIGFLSIEMKVVLVGVWYLLIFGYAFGRFLSWYFSVYIVTDRRIIDVDFHSILHKNISEAELSKVQDITHTSVGTKALLFNYGELKIQTAAEFSDIEFEQVPSPSEVHKIIGELLENIR